MTLSETILSGLKTIEADLGNQTFTWKGEDYICHPSGDTTDATLSDGGFDIAADKVLVVRKELFTNGIFPKSQEKLVFNNQSYRIEQVRNNATNSFLRLVCSSANKLK